MAYLELQNIAIEFSDFKIEDINIQLDKGKFLVLLGHSGSGKTSLIQAICGIVPIAQGKVLLNGVCINDLPIHKRKIGMVFQDFALFPHLNVFENIAFGLRIKKAKNIDKKVQDLLELIELPNYSKRRVYELSGGEKQRIALARTIAAEPDIILFDEPMSALDESLRDRLRATIKNVVKQMNITTIYVTHDQKEAFYLADYIGIMHAGRLIRYDTGDNIWQQPQNQLTADFLGVHNQFDATVKTKNHESNMFFYKLDVKGVELSIHSTQKLELNQRVKICFRAESVFLSFKNEGVNSFESTILDYKIFGSTISFTLQVQNLHISSKTFRIINLENYSNQTLYCTIPEHAISIID